MPIYEYKCKKCSKQEELIQKITDDSVPDCKDCQEPMVKLISTSSFELKGGGWYKDGYSH